MSLVPRISREELVMMSYRELQKIGKSLKVPCNIKKTYLIDVVYHTYRGDMGLVQAIAERAKRDRNYTVNVRRRSTKKRKIRPSSRLQHSEATSTNQINSPTKRRDNRVVIHHSYQAKPYKIIGETVITKLGKPHYTNTAFKVEERDADTQTSPELTKTELCCRKILRNKIYPIYKKGAKKRLKLNNTENVVSSSQDFQSPRVDFFNTRNAQEIEITLPLNGRAHQTEHDYDKPLDCTIKNEKNNNMTTLSNYNFQENCLIQNNSEIYSSSASYLTYRNILHTENYQTLQNVYPEMTEHTIYNSQVDYNVYVQNQNYFIQNHILSNDSGNPYLNNCNEERNVIMALVQNSNLDEQNMNQNTNVNNVYMHRSNSKNCAFGQSIGRNSDEGVTRNQNEYDINHNSKLKQNSHESQYTMYEHTIKEYNPINNLQFDMSNLYKEIQKVHIDDESHNGHEHIQSENNQTLNEQDTNHIQDQIRNENSQNEHNQICNIEDSIQNKPNPTQDGQKNTEIEQNHTQSMQIDSTNPNENSESYFHKKIRITNRRISEAAQKSLWSDDCSSENEIENQKTPKVEVDVNLENDGKLNILPRFVEAFNRLNKYNKDPYKPLYVNTSGPSFTSTPLARRLIAHRRRSMPVEADEQVYLAAGSLLKIAGSIPYTPPSRPQLQAPVVNEPGALVPYVHNSIDESNVTDLSEPDIPYLHEYLRGTDPMEAFSMASSYSGSRNEDLEALASQVEDMDSFSSGTVLSGMRLLRYDTGDDLGASVTVADTPIENDLDYVYVNHVDNVQCVLCEWNQSSEDLEQHYVMVHYKDIRVFKATILREVQVSLGELLREKRKAIVIRWLGKLYALVVKCEDPDWLLASLSTLSPLTETPLHASITIYNRVSGEPYSWEGPSLKTNLFFHEPDSHLKVQLSKMNVLPNSANVLLINGALVSNGKQVFCGNESLDEVDVWFHVGFY